jgi:predicted dehydrogenase
MMPLGPEQTVRVGIVGGGLMGKEAAAAIARWPALLTHPVRPVVTGVCDVDDRALDWFRQLSSISLFTADYRELLDSDVDVVYVAVRHDLHERIYSDVIKAGIDLFAEKPFGIDLGAAERMVSLLDAQKDVFVRCSSEFPFFPGAQKVIGLAQAGAFGQIVEASSGFSHSSDLDLGKALSWKRESRYCGEAGVMNDLGLHALHVPLRLGWWPGNVFAVLQDLVPYRPLPDGTLGRCDTIENATLLCTLAGPDGRFPLSVIMKRIDPGQMNTWTLRVIGMAGGAEFSTRYPKTVRRMRMEGKEQVWQEVEMGSQSVFPTITGAIFESGFSDAVQQMWASYLAERAGALGERFGCATPHEALDAHRIVAAAMESHRRTAAVRLPPRAE